jgi:sec-independent protein translocase protein TatA
MFSQFGIFNLGGWELLLILLIILLLFGAKKLPELARNAGKSARELRKGLEGDDGKSQKQTDEKRRQESAS